MSLSAPKKYINNTNSNQRTYKKNKRNQKLLAIEECKRLYRKYYAYPSSSLLNQLDDGHLILFLDQLNLKDITVITELLLKYFYIQKIEISESDPNKPEPFKTYRQKFRPIPLSDSQKKQIERDKKNKQKSLKLMINRLIISISKHLSSSRALISLSLDNIELTKEYSEYLSKAIINNKSLKNLRIANSKILLNSYELFIENLLNNTLLTSLDLSNNNFGDKYGKMISRLIIRQFQQRDQVEWFYGLRNELPSTNDYKKGLLSINLSGNNLSKDSAECISSALYSDQFIRAVYLNNNKMDKSSCKKFIYMMRKNLHILTIDLRGNPGYDNTIHSRLVMKMSKNIRYLYQQYKKEEYTGEEFENFKKYIDASFFDVDIPEDVVEFYNENLPENLENNENKENNDNNNVKTNLKITKNMSDIKEECKEDEDDIKNNFEKNKASSYKSINTTEENKKLYDENIKLKQQIIELKAKNLQLLLGGEGNNLNNNESNESMENDYNKVELLINELNDLMNKIEQKKSQIKKDDNNKNKEINKDNNNNSNVNSIKDTKIEKEEKINRPEIQEIILDENENEKEKENNEINENKNKNNDNFIINKNEIKVDNNQNKNIIIEEKEKKEKIEKNENDKNVEKKDDDKDINIKVENKTDEIINNIEESKKENENEKEKEKDKENNDNHFEDENGNIYNYDDLTDEEKIYIFQQQLILEKLQQEAEAKGEQFDPQEYLEFLERQEREEEENELSSDKMNKSF